MTFAARGLVVSLAFFAMVYCPLAIVVILAWQTLKRLCGKSTMSSANLLFGLRIFPFLVSAVVAIFFTLPSFWLMERSAPDEDAGTYILAFASLMILGAGSARVLKARTRTANAIAQWRAGSIFVEREVPHVIRSSNGVPPLILVGIRQPQVLISDAAVALLSEQELRVAIRHEFAHMRSWDNLKKVLVSSTPFPGMRSLENTWQSAAELAADDAAATNRQAALDLAAALIKLSRYSQLRPEAVLATGLVGSSSSIALRVERLLERRKAHRRFRQTRQLGFAALLTVVIGIASNYGAALILTHHLTELLVP